MRHSGAREARTRNPDAWIEYVSGFRVRPFGPSRNDRSVYAIAFFKFSSTLSRKPVVDSHFWLGPISAAGSLVIKPASTVSTQSLGDVRRRRTPRQNAAIAAFSVALGRIAADA